MATAKKKIDVHRLTISGDRQGKAYGTFLKSVWREAHNIRGLVFQQGTKSHALYSISILKSDLRMKFMSFTTGYRPDIVDVQDFQISPNPLKETQTGIDWTHVYGRKVGSRYLLLIERSRGGIFPHVLEEYLQWLVDEYYNDKMESELEEDQVSVNIEPEVDEEFVNRIAALDRISKATIRVVRPNPGWADLDSELSRESAESDAGKADVTMTAKRRGTLSKTKGIVGAILSSYKNKSLQYAAVEGSRGVQKDEFSTARLGKYKFTGFKKDKNGQIDDADAWAKMESYMNTMD